MPDPAEARRHQAKMAKKKTARDKILAAKTEERGLVIVHTGKGKGKSTAAWGMALRAIGHGMRVGVVQFVKGKWDTGERAVLERFGEHCVIEAHGEGFSWESQDLERDREAARRAWNAALAMMADPGFALIVLDEINIALRYGQLELETVLHGLEARSEGQHVVLTGRNAPDALIEAADLVTEMTLVKHPFRSGVKAQAGIEF
ncbi:MAG: cob(I)yrinic acid a,c-diamide adenosyltransferase [Alphaproteobacteria bacterium]|nr:cob(I)yrinic acid a,c-diamide adenosyltransferase [Alphaproteobacteria bacterium]MBF0251927.1 cob(I)yrinic acid a,c-diamide adenosyltransferase [Alphaproteobacteria bacterium]